MESVTAQATLSYLKMCVVLWTKKAVYHCCNTSVQAKKKISSARDHIGDEVLNDTYLCVPFGSEAYKDSVKNPHADVLFKLEDDLFDFDVMLGRCTTTIRALEQFLQKLNENPNEKPHIEDYLQGWLSFSF